MVYASIWQRVMTLALSVLAVATAVAAETDDAKEAGQSSIKKREPTEFIRIEHDEYKNPVVLQTGTAKYLLKDDAGQVKLEVFLESAVHVGDAAYYRGFNQRFHHYDAVLYELIAAKEKRIPIVEPDQLNVGRLLQQLTGDSLGFVHQIDTINYQAENFVHSDLSPAKMAELKEQRGEDEITWFADLLLDLSRRLNQAADAGKLKTTPLPKLGIDVLTDPDGAVKLRRLLAGTMDKGSPTASLHPAQAASLILDRNERAMQVFQEQLEQGKRKIAFFWGAAHMPDLEKRLILDYGLLPAGVTWRSAWDLREGAVSQTPLESILGNTLRDSVDRALKKLLESRGDGT